MERLATRPRVRAGLSSSSFFRLLSDGGTAVAGGGRVWLGRRRGRGQSSTAAQGFSDVRHQEGVAGQLQHVHAVLLVVSQATSDEGLQQVGEGVSLVNVWISVCLLLLSIPEENKGKMMATFASVVTTGFGGNCTSVAFKIVFS